ncbi:hypothetical protein HOI26_02065 [Candidatus Woesearchaeota archaeon]|jgi:hypothetical protein|nr:hypothetical protein [Candidatus Woesearchaeota archaeon]MBT5739863.1 hypothetical protein [Candidatus Woesearchaeota archaeon]
MGNSPQLRLKYDGLFDFDGLYAAIIDWAKRYGYRWHEAAYKHKVPSPAGAEQEFIWALNKRVDEYLDYEILFNVKVEDLSDVTVKNKHLSNGRINILIQGKVISDWNKDSGKRGKILSKFINFYKKQKVVDYTTEGGHTYETLYYRILDLHATMKKFFDMQSKSNQYLAKKS